MGTPGTSCRTALIGPSCAVCPGLQLQKRSRANLVGISLWPRQQTKILIKRDERRSRLPVDLEPDFDRFRPIIFFLKQTPCTAIAPACQSFEGVRSNKISPGIDRRFGARPTASRCHGQAVDGSPPPPASGPLRPSIASCTQPGRSCAEIHRG